MPALLEILDHSRPFVLVLDDVHLLRDDAVPGCPHLHRRGRPRRRGGGAAQPDDPHGRAGPKRRLSDQVVELGPDDLAFTVDDADRVFSGMGVADRRPTTWPRSSTAARAGPAASTSPPSRVRDRDGDPAPITGRNRLVADYLVEEVLNGLDDDTARFLEEASILEPMSAALLDHVLGRTDSGRQLAAVEATGNLFLIALDDEREWYRFHHLFGELLASTARASATPPD